MGLSYEDWNSILLNRFFNTDMAGREVIIFADPETIDSIGSEYGEGYETFCNTVKHAPHGAENDGICRKALASARGWRERGLAYPPYFAYLVLFVSAATIEGDFDGKAYYPRLRQVLDEEPIIGTYPSFEKMDGLWQDLETWSVVDQREISGRFTKRVRGGWAHVGIPLAQVIISESERNLLHQFFFEEGFDPADPPSEVVLERKLKNWGRTYLSHRTIALLNSTDAALQGLRSAVTELVAADLREWDSTYILPTGADEPRGGGDQGEIIAWGHICLKVDHFEGEVIPSLRVKAKQQFPDGGLSFNYNGEILGCLSSGIEGWSTKVLKGEGSDRKTFDPSQFDWLTGITLTDNIEAWTVHVKGQKVRVFLQGQGGAEGLSDWVELQRVSLGSRYLICSHTSVSEEVSSWGTVGNLSFRQLSLTGLPPDWVLFEVNGIQTSFPGCDALVLPQTTKFHIEGGVHVGRTNQYLAIAPPNIILDSGLDGGDLFVNNQPLAGKESEVGVFSLPSNLPAETRLTIELRRADGSLVQKRDIFLIAPEIPTLPDKLIMKDKFGKIIGQSMVEGEPMGIIGVKPVGLHIPPISAEHLPTYLSHRIFFIGRVVGQIVEWPDQGLPKTWQPVWAVAKEGRRWQVYFCGSESAADMTPLRETTPIPPKDRKRWKRQLYNKRDEISPPKFRQHQILWGQYRRFAKGV